MHLCALPPDHLLSICTLLHNLCYLLFCLAGSHGEVRILLRKTLMSVRIHEVQDVKRIIQDVKCTVRVTSMLAARV